MKIRSIEYRELMDSPNRWSLARAQMEQINLIVGKNAAGKTRLLSIINSLAKLLTGQFKAVFKSGEYKVEFASSSSAYQYELIIKDARVERELLVKDEKRLLDRKSGGAGDIWAEELKRFIQFESPPSVIAAHVRRDSIQHPFLEELYQWAADLRFYPFGTPLGKNHLFAWLPNPSAEGQKPEEPKGFNPEETTKLYVRAFSEFGEAFDEAVLRDFAALGYDCTDVGAEQADPGIVSGPPVAIMFVKERDLPAKTTQLAMSAGMFRALALIINLNDCLFRKVPRTLLIDDIGEGLDFSRSKSFISLLISRAAENSLQLIMTTNDRFVMNGVPLQYWSVIHRDAGNVRLVNKTNSASIFREFEEIGLSNFDFFSTNFFEQEAKN